MRVGGLRVSACSFDFTGSPTTASTKGRLGFGALRLRANAWVWARGCKVYGVQITKLGALTLLSARGKLGLKVCGMRRHSRAAESLSGKITLERWCLSGNGTPPLRIAVLKHSAYWNIFMFLLLSFGRPSAGLPCRPHNFSALNPKP